MGVRRLRMIDGMTAVLPYTFYVVLALFLLDTVINRVLHFLARYPVLSDLFASELVARIGALSFIFGDISSIFLLLFLIILLFGMKPGVKYIALPMIPLFAADVLRYLLRTTFELSVLTALLNLSSLIIIQMAVLSRLKLIEIEKSSVKAPAYIYLSLLTAILILQHLYQLNILIPQGQPLSGSIILEVTPYLMVFNAFFIAAYAFATSRESSPRVLAKPESFVSVLLIIMVVLGLLYVNSLAPQAIPELLILVFGLPLQTVTVPFVLLGLVSFISATLILWLKVDSTYVYRQEAIGLLTIFTATFLFGSIYYYPRVVIGILFVSVPLFKNRWMNG